MPEVFQFPKLMGQKHLCTWKWADLLPEHTLKRYMEGLLIEVQRVHDFKCPNSAQLELLYECNYMGMAHHCRYTPKPQKMAANTGKTALGICQTKVVKYNLGVKSHQYHKCQASGTVSPGFSAVLQITDSSMTCCKHLQTYLSTAATPKVAVLVGLQRIVP